MGSTIVRTDRIGEKHKLIYGEHIAEIVDYRGRHDVDVLIDGVLLLKKLQYYNIKKGHVYHNSFRTVYGVGFIGDGVYCKKDYISIYTSWQGMLKRCYSEKYKEKYPTYKGCTVCDEWHNFQNFAKWVMDEYNGEIDGLQLDKDILFKGNKVYSPNNCVFVIPLINNLFIDNNSNSNKTLPLGVTKSRCGNGFYSTIKIFGLAKRIGTFKTIDDAKKSYNYRKLNYLKEISEKYKEEHWMKDVLYNKLNNYKLKDIL